MSRSGGRRGSPERRPPEDCTVCGACCFSAEPGYIRVFAADAERMDDAARALTEPFVVGGGEARAMRFVAGRCAALRRQGERWLCAIYPMRPDACRWLERGSGHCLDIIRASDLVRRPKP